MIGQTISQYRILEKLGSGGMGVVYKAEDTRLNRIVAIKALPAGFQTAEQKSRFMREARAAAALDHPNICPIHEVIEDATGAYLVMSFVDGATLTQTMAAGRLSIDEVLRIATQICAGLDAAHRKSIIHRDIKPQNILLTREGLVRLVDFGLAHHVDETHITQTGITLGTPPYMSPEQWAGVAADHRSDLWSFGVVLYAMLTGQLPFAGDRAVSFGYAVVHKSPAPMEPLRPDLPPQLGSLVMKLLAKDPAQRPQSAAECLTILNALQDRSASSSHVESLTQTMVATRTAPVARSLSRRTVSWLAAVPVALGGAGFLISRFTGGGRWGASASPRSIAVLPFVNTTGDREADYLSDGLADELTNALTKAASLRVVARTSAFQFRNQQQDLRRIADQLSVAALLTGTVARDSGRVRVSVQLVNAADGYQIWSQIYDRPASEIFYVQEEISRETLRRLDAGRQEFLTASKHHSPDTAAYNFYLQGRYLWNKRTEQNFRKAVQLFDKAVAADPLYPQPYSGLADAYALLGLFGQTPPKDTLPMAKAAARKALELDPSLAEAHISLALALLIFDWNFAESEREFQRGLALGPGYATASHWYAYYLVWTGRFDEAMKQIGRAQELDPLALSVKTNSGWFWYLQRRYDRAIETFRSVLAVDPDFTRARIYLAAAYAQSGRPSDAIRVIQDSQHTLPDDERLMATARTLALAGQISESQALVVQLRQLSERRYISPYVFAMVHAAGGNLNAAFDSLEKAYEERSAMMVFLKVDPRLDNLRSDSRFAALMKRMAWPN